MRRILSEGDLTQEQQEKTLDLILRFFDDYADGSLGSHAAQILSDENYENMIASLWNANYGPWMKSVLESEPLDASHLEIIF